MKNLGKMTGEMGFTQKSSLKKCNHSTTKEEIKKATPSQYIGILLIEYASSPSNIRNNVIENSKSFEYCTFNLSSCTH